MYILFCYPVTSSKIIIQIYGRALLSKWIFLNGLTVDNYKNTPSYEFV